ncbi:hypothetical protein DTW90_31420 [Neorhizobium sp. P12A]|uniref:hypothetical protein n=1 Tax=Rhizobium/Agrobacterium group TaxID=227290 RepID=UPI0010443FF8|nr:MULTISPECIES: hypothetical protein [Rhizobium/Agrobacterium group]KAA0689417.1 hypothetical protein DTW90_31420 [Neorhizobium sp. P12A]TCR69280.1 hypothetical protein EV561_1418 [Rhizobium sp. BK376]
MNRRLLTAAIILLSLASCAKRPGAIEPADIPMAAYQNDGCPALAANLKTEQSKLDSLSKDQNNAANGDAFGVFMIGVPVSSLTGADKAGDIAVEKGKVQAIQNQQHAKGCKV